MKKRSLRLLLCTAALLTLIWSERGASFYKQADGAVGSITVKLTETPEAFKNPIMGFRPSRGINDSSFPKREYADIYKHYIKYTDLEFSATDSVQKIVDWSNKAWVGIEKKNIKVVPRVVIVYPGAGEFWPNGIAHGDPVNEWLSEDLKSRLVAFIGKLGQAWDNDPRVAFVELGLYGNWGEHHIYPDQFDDRTNRIPLSFQTALGDAYTAAFHNKKVLVRYPETFADYDFGVQWDSFALSDDAASGKGEISRDSWRTQINSGEVAYNWGNQSNLGGSPNGTLSSTSNTNHVIDWIMNTHTSSLGWISDYTASNPAVEAGATAMQKMLGYRFVLNQATFTGNVSPGGTMNVSFQVTNKGSSPFYYNWPVEASLLKSDGTVAWKGVFQDDIRNWLPGTGWNETTRAYDQAPAVNMVNGMFVIPKSVPNGTYILSLSILDPAGWKPSVRFANTNYYTGGSTPIGKVGIGNNPTDQNLGSFASLKSDTTLGYSLQSSAYSGSIGSGNSTVIVNGKALSFEAKPIIINGNIMVPFRQIFESLDMKVKWDNATKSVIASKENLIIKMANGSAKASVNNKEFILTPTPFVSPESMFYVNLRFVSEASGATVAWDNVKKTASITTDK
ncbi:Copper amine oxidase N-terminal domain-containing protein [Paenibacillus sp. OV219]|nr:Copper amine oxidase N-terminal domain-containing protein [Paenibacillus sp. OV219]